MESSELQPSSNTNLQIHSESASPRRSSPWLLLVLLLGGGGGIGLWRVFAPSNQSPPATVQQPLPTPVKTLSVQTSQIVESSEFIASLQSRRSVTLRPRIQGQVSEIFVRAGERVETGTPVLKVDANQQQASVESRIAGVESSQADLETARAEAAIAKAQATIIKNQRLVKQAQANVKQQAVQLQFYTIAAPFAGTVGDLPVKMGDFVDTSTRLTTITENRSLEVTFSVPNEQALQLRPGMPVELTDGQGRKVGTSRVFFIWPKATNDTQ